MELEKPAPASRILIGNALEVLPEQPDKSVQCCVTSPPYWGLRDYGHPDQIGLEKTPEEYVEKLVRVFREVHRMLADDGTLWLNIGDSYVGSPGGFQGQQGRSGRESKTFSARLDLEKRAGRLPPKSLIGIPWRLAFALQADGWILRSEIIWTKPNPMPESVADRPSRAHEQVFLFAKSGRYFYDADAVREPHVDKRTKKSSASSGRGQRTIRPASSDESPDRWYHKAGRNLRDVWTIAPQPFAGAHFATMPIGLVEPCILAGCPSGGVVLDPFAGAGTVGLVASRHGRLFLGVELNEAYATMARERIVRDAPLLNEVAG